MTPTIIATLYFHFGPKFSPAFKELRPLQLQLMTIYKLMNQSPEYLSHPFCTQNLCK